MNKIFKQAVFFLSLLVVLIACKEGTQKQDKPVTAQENPHGKELFMKFYADSTVQTKYIVLNDDSTKVRVQTFHRNGVLSIEGVEFKGERIGEWLAYDDKGNMQSKANYVNGLAEGLKTVYYPNGQIRYQGMMKENKMIGVWRFFNAAGELLKEEDYDKK